ncbi:MAG: PIN domain-containing protein [Euryarchaeota archaeon]|nr:PIN domain-containing protein [Euryarchaeota archaeon]MDE1835708.1 PIN domain-containing protein [Euryarchaeota archaeon]MDE1881558.1 PIN domain-containing protein [Euryarchaeota archaeon]MDE2043898.1 PIN domain-containing protein [Thermoplasmata archaeon]
MPVLDATFLIDVSKDVAEAVERSRALESENRPLRTVAPVFTEVMAGAYLKGGKYLDRTARMFDTLEVVTVDRDLADEAARLGGDALRVGASLGAVDLAVAALAVRRHDFVVSRDPDFGRVPGLLVSRY